MNTQNIANFVSHNGFYILDQDGRELLVCSSEGHEELGRLHDENEKAGIAFVLANQERTVEITPFSDRDIVIEDNTDLFFAGYDAEKKEVCLYSGNVSKINDQNNESNLFSFKGDEFLNHPAAPVFEISSSDDLYLVGVISGLLQRIILIDDLIPERGKINRLAKICKAKKKEAKRIRAEAKINETFRNTGAPEILYRFVSKEDAKIIKKDGIEHQGSEEDEIPFITQPDKNIANSIGARFVDKMVSVYTDKIPDISQDNVATMRQRNGVLIYKLNIRIPPEAIEISDA